MELGNKHQTTPREATNDPGNDNLNALKNAHLTPRAIKAIQRGVDIKNEDSTEDSTTDGRKQLATPKKQQRAKPAPPKKVNRSTPTPKPKKETKTVSKAPTRTRSTPKPIRRSTPTQKKSKAPEKSLSTSIGLLDLLRM
jgi:hypothetical protein